MSDSELGQCSDYWRVQSVLGASGPLRVAWLGTPNGFSSIAIGCASCSHNGDGGLGLLHCTHILDYFSKKWPIFSMHEKVPQVAQTEKHGDIMSKREEGPLLSLRKWERAQ